MDVGFDTSAEGLHERVSLAGGGAGNAEDVGQRGGQVHHLGLAVVAGRKGLPTRTSGTSVS